LEQLCIARPGSSPGIDLGLYGESGRRDFLFRGIFCIRIQLFIDKNFKNGKVKTIFSKMCHHRMFTICVRVDYYNGVRKHFLRDRHYC